MPREIHQGTKDKLKILRAYLPAYLTATTRATQRIYIDAFAGPGMNVVWRTGEFVEGSPLIAAQAQAKNGSRFTRLYFIEIAQQDAQELQQLIRERFPSAPVTVHQGDCNALLPTLMAALHPRTPIFVFLDTQGLEPAWATIESLATRRTELLINFPLGMSIKRNLQNEERITRYFGTDRWKRSLAEGTTIGEALLRLYTTRLRDVGYPFIVENPRLVRGPKRQPLYYLMFAGKVDIGKRIMDAVFAQPDAVGQTRFKI